MDYKGNISANQKKANCISTKNYHSDMDLICVAQRGHEYRGESAHFIPSTTPGKTNCLTTVAKDNLIAEMKDKQIIQVNPSSESNGKQPYQQNRVYDANGKSPALMSGHAQSSINTLMGGIGLQL